MNDTTARSTVSPRYCAPMPRTGTPPTDDQAEQLRSARAAVDAANLAETAARKALPDYVLHLRKHDVQPSQVAPILGVTDSAVRAMIAGHGLRPLKRRVREVTAFERAHLVALAKAIGETEAAADAAREARNTLVAGMVAAGVAPSKIADEVGMHRVNVYGAAAPSPSKG